FGAGMDRLLLAMQAQNVLPEPEPLAQAFVATVGKGLTEKAFEVATNLRRVGLTVEMEYQERSLKAQMKTANKLRASYVVLLGEDELAQQAATLRNMQDGSQETVPLAELPSRLAARTN
ncbi:MAG: His/Gly/Thr/Pro-type tRNA ligase C-terminal domain-containing protein, partial [Candidatus Poribacteria bacterium]|nr:His/Gly/Thr/Pro-type tRNA ligase C-terminal domain-containing protein [Candidatus Poribacteria bacterium]